MKTFKEYILEVVTFKNNSHWVLSPSGFEMEKMSGASEHPDLFPHLNFMGREANNGGTSMILDGNPNENLNWAHSPYFDFTVAKANNTVYNGRVHSDKWAFVAVQPTNGAEVQFSVNINSSSSPIIHTYTDDKAILKIEFQPNFRPVAYDVAVNSYGVVNTSNFAVNRRSINSSVSP